MTAAAATAPERPESALSTIEDYTEKTDLYVWSKSITPRRVIVSLEDSTTLESEAGKLNYELIDIDQLAGTTNVNRVIGAARQTYIEALESLKLKLLVALKSEPFEDGIPHPAEDVIRESLLVAPTYKILQVIETMFDDSLGKQPSIAGTMLRIIGRMPRNQVGAIGIALVSKGLLHKEPGVRMSAVRALESWGGPQALRLLARHQESESQSWLKRYIKQVINDLTA